MIMKLSDVKSQLRDGPYAWPGGYPKYFITTDGEALSFDAVKKHWRDVCEAHIVSGYNRSGWGIEAVDINWEDTELVCAETGEPIQSAYGE